MPVHCCGHMDVRGLSKDSNDLLLVQNSGGHFCLVITYSGKGYPKCMVSVLPVVSCSMLQK